MIETMTNSNLIALDVRLIMITMVRCAARWNVPWRVNHLGAFCGHSLTSYPPTVDARMQWRRALTYSVWLSTANSLQNSRGTTARVSIGRPAAALRQ